MLYYAIADIHGRFDLLDKAFLAIAEDVFEHDVPDNFKIITTGDYIDRGLQSKEVIECLMSAQEADKDRVICLQGNHEAIAVETIQTPLDPNWWFGNGGDATMRSYGNMLRRYTTIGYDPHMLHPEHVTWMANLPLHYETEHHIFVHAGIPYRDLPISRQDPEQMQWMLYDPNDHGGWMDKHVVHGHHQFADGPHEWRGRTDLDCHAYYTGRLVVGVFSSDTPGKAIRYLEVLGDDYQRDSGEAGSPRAGVV